MTRTPQNRGFMQIVLLAIVIIVGLAYFNVDLHAIAQNPGVQKAITILGTLWDNFILPALKYLGQSVQTIVDTGNMATSSVPTIDVMVAE